MVEEHEKVFSFGDLNKDIITYVIRWLYCKWVRYNKFFINTFIRIETMKKVCKCRYSVLVMR